MRIRGFIVLIAVMPAWAWLYFWARSLKVNQVEWFPPLSAEIQQLQAAGWVTLLATISGLGLLAFDCVQWLRKKTR
jgi:hypothetical protein